MSTLLLNASRCPFGRQLHPVVFLLAAMLVALSGCAVETTDDVAEPVVANLTSTASPPPPLFCDEIGTCQCSASGGGGGGGGIAGTLAAGAGDIGMRACYGTLIRKGYPTASAFGMCKTLHCIGCTGLFDYCIALGNKQGAEMCLIIHNAFC